MTSDEQIQPGDELQPEPLTGDQLQEEPDELLDEALRQEEEEKNEAPALRTEVEALRGLVLKIADAFIPTLSSGGARSDLEAAIEQERQKE